MPSVQRHNLNKLQTYSLPSARSIDLTPVPTNSVITAPADGYFYINTFLINEVQVGTLSLFNRKLTFSEALYGERIHSNFMSPVLFCPVSKGDRLIFTSDNVNIRYFRFIYAVGSQPA